MQARSTLFGTAAIVAGLFAVECARAQTVYSLNAVALIRVTVPVGLSTIANPLTAEDNRIAALFPNVPDGTVIYKFLSDPPSFSINAYEVGWSRPDDTLLPGEGAFIMNPGPEPLMVSFYGDIPQGSLSSALPAGLSFRSSPIPVPGALDKDLGFPTVEGDMVYRFRRASNPEGYSVHEYSFGAWNVAPMVDPGEAFFVNKVAPANWTKTFSVTE